MKYWEYQELLLYAVGKTESEVEELIDEGVDLDAVAYKHFKIDFNQFMGVAETLLPLTPMVESVMTSKLYHAFVRKSKINGVIAVVKVDA